MNGRSILFSFAALCLGSAMEAQEPIRGAKELFYDPTGGVTSVAAVSEKPSPSNGVRRASAPLVDQTGRRMVALPASGRAAQPGGSLGLSYWIELETPGSASGIQVTEGRTFKSGERIRLHFRSNSAGFISILQLGASGSSQILFPDSDQGLVDAAFPANEERILPSKDHWFRFDQNPGKERLIVIFARDRNELDSLPLMQRMDRPATDDLIRSASHLRGSKDLVIETEAQTSSEIGTYGVNLKGQPVILEIVLEHR